MPTQKAQKLATLHPSTVHKIFLTVMANFSGTVGFAKNTRNHWSIENRLHWVLDVVFKEDESRIRKDHAPENISLIRKMALNMLKKENTEKSGIAIKRKMAGWDNSYLLKVLAA